MAFAALAALLVTGCGTGAGTAVLAPDRVVAGPQGRVGQFVVECGLDRFVPDDPIVHPGEAGASHLHAFFGAVGVTADSAGEELTAGDTTCQRSADTASYWAPTLVDDAGELIEPIRAVAYYRAGPDVDPTSVVAYPPGFMMVAGDHTATEPQPTSVVAWTCGAGSQRSATPLDCSGAPSLRMIVTFPDCWDGQQARSPVVPQPNLHVAYSAGGACPAQHPVHVPQLQLAIDYPIVPAGEIDGLLLSSGDIHSGHADFWNTWDQRKLQTEVSHCLHRNLTCGVTSR